MKKHQRLVSAIVVNLLIFLSVLSPALASDTRDIASRVDELFAAWNSDDQPGAVVAVIQNGQIIYQKGYGMADLERGVPITTESAFEIGSISKQFTAMCILLLENDDMLGLDDDIRTYIPEMPEYERRITLRHLLHHTSGVRDIEALLPLTGMSWVNYYTDDYMLGLITRQKALNFVPGEQFLYSNSGYILLAQVVSRVSGQSLRDFAQERIFGPLGMEHSVFWDRPGQIVPNRALAYSPQGENGYKLEMWNMPFVGPAGLYSTVGDLALWDANFYENKLGGGAELIEKMETPGLLDNGESTGYAAGLIVKTHGGLPVLTHDGAWMGYRGFMRRFPGQHVTITVLSNVASLDVRVGWIANLFLADDFVPSEQPSGEFVSPTAIELEAAELSRYEGTYWNDSDSLLRTIVIRDGRLHYLRSNGDATELGAVETGRFFMVGLQTPVSVEFHGSGESCSMMVVVGDQAPQLFEPLPELSDDALTAFCGVYWSDDLRRELQVNTEGNNIVATWVDEQNTTVGRLVRTDDILLRQFVPIPWNPMDTRLRFERDNTGDITGLSLSCDMVRGVLFKKRTKPQ